MWDLVLVPLLHMIIQFSYFSFNYPQLSVLNLYFKSMNSLLTQGLAGIQPINVPGIENVRFSFYITLVIATGLQAILIFANTPFFFALLAG